MHSGLLALADSQDFITGSMARLLGDATVFRLYQIRERKGVATSRQDNDEGTFPDTYTTVADDVAHAFREELRGIYDASRAYRGNMEASERDTSTTQKRKANGDAGLPRAAPNSPAILAMEQIKPAVSDAPLNDPSPVAGPSHATSSGVSMDTQRVTFKVGSGDEMNVDQPSSPDNVPAVSSPCNRGSLTTPPVKRETIKHEHVNVKIEASRDVRIPLVQGTSLPDPGQPQTSKKDSPTAPSAGPSAGTSQASQNLNIESSTKQTLPSSIAEKIHTPTKPPPVATVKALAPKQPQTGQIITFCRQKLLLTLFQYQQGTMHLGHLLPLLPRCAPYLEPLQQSHPLPSKHTKWFHRLRLLPLFRLLPHPPQW